MYPFCTSLEKDCFNIATKRIATKRIATKRISTERIATERIATKGIAMKGIAFPDLSDLCNLSDPCEKQMFYKKVFGDLVAKPRVFVFFYAFSGFSGLGDSSVAL